jgi:surface antigen
MRGSLSFAAVLVCAAWAMQPYPSTASTLSGQAQRAQYEPQPNCREFTAAVTVGGQPQQAFGQACQQPDGTWRIPESTPGSPPQVYTLPPQAIYAAPYPYPYYWADPWAYGPSVFVGGSIFFADDFRRFHDHDGFRRFHDRDGFHHDGFHDGFRHDEFHGGGFHARGFHGGGFHGGGHR